MRARRGCARSALRRFGCCASDPCRVRLSRRAAQVWECRRAANQLWAIRAVPGGAQIYSIDSSRCVTAVQTQGTAVGLDAGFTVIAARLQDCGPDGAPDQTFDIEDAVGFPHQFPLRTLPTAPGGGGLCLQPQVVRVPHFDAVAFLLPDGSRTLVAINVGDEEVRRRRRAERLCLLSLGRQSSLASPILVRPRRVRCGLRVC